jgi:hypothetical protein
VNFAFRTCLLARPGASADITTQLLSGASSGTALAT